MSVELHSVFVSLISAKQKNRLGGDTDRVGGANGFVTSCCVDYAVSEFSTMRYTDSSGGGGGGGIGSTVDRNRINHVSSIVCDSAVFVRVWEPLYLERLKRCGGGGGQWS